MLKMRHEPMVIRFKRTKRVRAEDGVVTLIWALDGIYTITTKVNNTLKRNNETAAKKDRTKISYEAN
jgi:hypothetical protein